MHAARSATILGCLGPQLTRAEAAFFAEVAPVGFILFARNVETPDQVRRLTGDLRDAVGWQAPIFVDQEGGRVQRLRAPHWREWLPPLDQVAKAGPEGAARSMYLRSYLIGREHLAIGIDGNCAPCADIARANTHPFLRNRCYGEDIETVVKISRAVAEGVSDAGVFPVMKHMPGHGLGTLDSHHDLPHVTASRDELEQTDFAAFRALRDLHWGMSAHLVFERIDPDAPATLSPAMIRLIREEIGFDGLLMTDDLSMNALPGSLTDRAARARAAGCDVVLHCNGKPDEMEAVVTAAGGLDEAASKRLSRALGSRRRTMSISEREALSELEALLK
ncbi:glycoside hydrolase family 3 N-terminal domain-containing protein [Nioella ostreopsis]|uniref:glycoside hydrolase family 3 N-terminal domain-containing protein n=1 Tax=Nioella ostreopsis TaxID=2448479 RepID=UPI000FDBCF16|nr:glycoside hydrolase family 3 N-terminal domain-containing protein [Nioella ostreopsis]